AGQGVILAIAAEDHGRLRGCRGTAESAAAAGTRRCAGARGAAAASSAGAARSATAGGRARATRAAAAAAEKAAEAAAGTADIQAPDIALAYRSVPGGLDLTGFCIGRDAVVHAVVDEDVGIGDAAERAVQVADDRGLPGRAASVVVAPLAHHRREIHRLGVPEVSALAGIVAADSEARLHEVRERSGLPSRVVLVVHESGVHHVMTQIVVLVTADWEIRQHWLRQAAAVSLFRVGRGVADVF